MEVTHVECFLPELCKALKALDPNEVVRLYYNTKNWVFTLAEPNIILYDAHITGIFLGSGNAVQIYTKLNQMLVRDCMATQAVEGNSF